MTSKSLFIVFEGIDGSGKSTLTKNVHREMNNLGYSAWLGHEPTDFETGIQIRKFLRHEVELNAEEQLNLFIEDRKLSVNRNILPQLEKGNHVILDRYYYSTAAYQGKNIFSAERILQLNLDNNFPTPDLLFYLDIIPGQAMARVNLRGKSESFEKLATLDKISKIYNHIIGNKAHRMDALLDPETLTTIALGIIESAL